MFWPHSVWTVGIYEHTHARTRACTRTVSEFAEEFSSHSLLCNIFQAKPGNECAHPYCTGKSSDRSMHEPTRNHDRDPLAEKATTESDNRKQGKAPYAKMKCKSLSRGITTGLTTIAEESESPRYRNICML